MIPQTEQDFLRSKTRGIASHEETTTEIVDGEVRRQITTRDEVKRESTEPDFIKVYYKTMMALHNVEEIPLTFLLALSNEMGFTNGNRIYFYNNVTTRRNISAYMGVGDNMVSKYIRRCLTKGILFRTGDRGTYEVNPWLIARGRWSAIREIQTNFRYVAGKWERVIEEAAEIDDDAAQG